VIVATQLKQPGMEQNLIAAPLQHGALEVVVKNHSRLARPCLKRMHMPAQEVFQGLIEKELQIQGARIRIRVMNESGRGPRLSSAICNAPSASFASAPVLWFPRAWWPPSLRISLFPSFDPPLDQAVSERRPSTLRGGSERGEATSWKR
jgi:hypothetical protein